MAIPITQRENTASTVDGTSFAGAGGYTPTANQPIFIHLTWSKASTPDLPTSVTGFGLTFTRINDVSGSTIASPTKRSASYVAIGAAPSSTAVSVSFGANTQTGCVIIVEDATSGAAWGSVGEAVPQSATNRSDSIAAAGTLTATLGTLRADNRSGVAINGWTSTNNAALSPESGWQQSRDTGYGTPTTGAYVGYSGTALTDIASPGNDPTATVTIDTATKAVGILAFEIAQIVALDVLAPSLIPGLDQWWWEDPIYQDDGDDIALGIAAVLSTLGGAPAEPIETFAAQPALVDPPDPEFYQDDGDDSTHGVAPWAAFLPPSDEVASGAIYPHLHEWWWPADETEDYSVDRPAALEPFAAFLPPADEVMSAAAYPHLYEWWWPADETEDYATDGICDLEFFAAFLPPADEVVAAALWDAVSDQWADPELFDPPELLEQLEAFVAGPPAVVDDAYIATVDVLEAWAWDPEESWWTDVLPEQLEGFLGGPPDPDELTLAAQGPYEVAQDIAALFPDPDPGNDQPIVDGALEAFLAGPPLFAPDAEAIAAQPEFPAWTWAAEEPETELANDSLERPALTVPPDAFDVTIAIAGSILAELAEEESWWSDALVEQSEFLAATPAADDGYIAALGMPEVPLDWWILEEQVAEALDDGALVVAQTTALAGAAAILGPDLPLEALEEGLWHAFREDVVYALLSAAPVAVPLPDFAAGRTSPENAQTGVSAAASGAERGSEGAGAGVTPAASSGARGGE